jgi:hypothetical protein
MYKSYIVADSKNVNVHEIIQAGIRLNYFGTGVRVTCHVHIINWDLSHLTYNYISVCARQNKRNRYCNFNG